MLCANNCHECLLHAPLVFVVFVVFVIVLHFRLLWPMARASLAHDAWLLSKVTGGVCCWYRPRRLHPDRRAVATVTQPLRDNTGRIKTVSPERG